MARLFRGDCRVLIVEDEYVLAYQLKTALEGEGVIVLGPVASESDARAAIGRAGTVDGVVLDLNLGGRLTYGLADYLLAEGIPFLFATGYDESAIAMRYRHVPYTQKPVSAAFVAAALGCGSAK
jgi:CheY-like chemotaxis protein